MYGSRQDAGTQLHLARCFNHAEREAAVRCPECGRFFCRECVAEHKRRFLCARCITTETGLGPPTGRLARRHAAAHLILGLLSLWLAFYVMGWTLLRVPSTFHEASPPTTMRELP